MREIPVFQTEFEPNLFHQAKVEVVRVQVERFHSFYSNYFNRPETVKMADFFFDKVYTLNERAEWIQMALSTYDKVKSLMKETTRENLERLIDLNFLTDELDNLMAELILKDGWQVGQKLSLEEYKQYFIQLGQKEKRKSQLEIVLHNLESFYQLAHRPINSILIKPASMMAKLMGISMLFQTVEEGYEAVLPVKEEIFRSFIQEVTQREWDYLYSAFPDLPRTNPGT